MASLANIAHFDDHKGGAAGVRRDLTFSLTFFPFFPLQSPSLSLVFFSLPLTLARSSSAV